MRKLPCIANIVSAHRDRFIVLFVDHFCDVHYFGGPYGLYFPVNYVERLIDNTVSSFPKLCAQSELPGPAR